MMMSEGLVIVRCYPRRPPQCMQSLPLSKWCVALDRDSYHGCTKCSPCYLPCAFLELYTLLTLRTPVSVFRSCSLLICPLIGLLAITPCRNSPSLSQGPSNSQMPIHGSLFSSPVLAPSLLSSPLCSAGSAWTTSHLSPGRRSGHL